MFERELMISGLRRQRHLLAALIAELEKRPAMNFQDQQLCGEKAREVAGNLRKLRKIKDSYFTFQEIEFTPTLPDLHQGLTTRFYNSVP